MTEFTMPEEGEKKEFKICPEGTHVARCINFIDIGTHSFEWQGEIKEPRKVRLSWELPNETAVFKEGEEEKPFMVSTELTLSFHEKSNLFKVLSGWIGFKEGDKFNPEMILGVPCLVSIQHGESKKGNKFANVSTVSPIMKGTECPKQVNDSVYFFMGYNGHPSEFDDKLFESLPAFIQEKIEKSPEYFDAHSIKDPIDSAKEVFAEKKTS